MTVVIFFILGLIIGSFLNAVIFRLPDGKSFLTGRSECRNCHHELSSADLVPIFSFIFLRGQCRYCRQRISWQYPLVELATGIVFGLLAYQSGSSLGEPGLWASAVFAAFLIVVGIYDFKHFLILDRVVLPAAVLALIWAGFEGYLLASLYGALLVAGFFAAQYYISRGRWIGFGDVKLGIFLGLLLGWQLSLLMLVLAYFLGAATGLGLVLLGRKTMSSKLPLGSFLAISAIMVMLYGDGVLAWYLKLIGF